MEIENIIENIWYSEMDKGKLAAKRGRKTTGLSESAGLPDITVPPLGLLSPYRGNSNE